MKSRILSLVLSLAIMTSLFTSLIIAGPAGADASPTLDVYVQRGSGVPVLLHTYTQAEFMTLPNITQAYTAVDNLPTYVQAEGRGVTFTALLYAIQQYDAYHNVTFGTADNMNVKATDGFNKTFYNTGGTNTASKFYNFMNVPRYYFPNCVTTVTDPTDMSSDALWVNDTSGAVPVQPFLCVYSVWSRSITRVNDQEVKSFDDVPLGTIVTKAVLDAHMAQADSVTAYRAFRIAFGLAADEVGPDAATAQYHGYWLYRITFNMPVKTITIGSMTNGAVTSNAGSSGASAGDTVTLTVNPDTGYQLKAGTLAVTYSGGSTALTQTGSNTYTFVMPAAAVNVNAQFESGAVSVTGVSLNKNTDTLTVGGTDQLIATVSPSNATNQNVTWSSTNSAVATVSATGLVTAVAAGDTAVTVTTADGGFTASCTVTVNTANVAVTGVNLNKNADTLAVGGIDQLIATVSPSNATNKNVTWSSGNPAVVTVGSTGLVTAVAAGSANIIVVTVDGGKSAVCVVTVSNNACSIAASAGVNGSISPAGAVTVISGSNQTFIITPGSGCQVADVVVDGISVGKVTAYTFTGVVTNHTIVASFSPVSYTVAASVNGGNGNIGANPVAVNSGGSSVITISPMDGYRLAALTDNGMDVLGQVSNNTYIIGNITADHIIAAAFVPSTSTTITPSSTAGNIAVVSLDNTSTAPAGSSSPLLPPEAKPSSFNWWIPVIAAAGLLFVVIIALVVRRSSR